MGITHNPYGFYPLYDDAPVIWMPVKTTQTIVRGDPVILDTGQVAIAATNSAAIVGVAAGPCDSLTAGTPIPVWADPTTIFVGRQDDTTACVPGYERDISGATGAFMLDGNGSTYDIFMLLTERDFDEADAIGKQWVVRINKHEFAQVD